MRIKIALVVLFFIINKTSVAQKSERFKSVATINMDRAIGTIRPLHGGNLGPVSALKVLDFTDFFKECKVPFIRLHDVPWFHTYAVDITTIFRDFRADPSDPSNYDFRQTDDYMATVVNTGANITYRLGESIEWTPKKYNVNPPEDYKKWAEICLGIIRHYNEGWADGFHYNIKYWEIWNEPDCGMGAPADPSSWTGTDDQFFELYKTAAKIIKGEFPDIKIGGPSSCRPTKLENGVNVINDFTDKFLAYCQKDAIPLDFFSWHRYDTDPWVLAHLSTVVRDGLDRYGFKKTESILNEWNYTPPRGDWKNYAGGEKRVEWYDRQTSVKGGAFLANVLMLLQDEPIDEANFYTITNGAYGLFSDLGVAHKYAYAFKAFAELVNNTPERLNIDFNKEDSLVMCAGTNKEKNTVSVLVSNFTDVDKSINFKLINNFLQGKIKYEVYAVDEHHNLSKVKSYDQKNGPTFQVKEKVKGPSVLLLKWSTVERGQ